MPCFQPWGPTFVDPKASGAGPATWARARGSRLGLPYAGMRAHPPRDPPGRPLGRQKWVPMARNMVSPYFEGAESSPGLGFPRFQGIMGVRGLKPEDMTQNGSKSCPEPSRFLKTGQNTLTRPCCRPNNFFLKAPTPP